MTAIPIPAQSCERTRLKVTRPPPILPASSPEICGATSLGDRRVLSEHLHSLISNIIRIKVRITRTVRSSPTGMTGEALAKRHRQHHMARQRKPGSEEPLFAPTPAQSPAEPGNAPEVPEWTPEWPEPPKNRSSATKSQPVPNPPENTDQRIRPPKQMARPEHLRPAQSGTTVDTA